MTQPAPASRHAVDNLIDRAERGHLTGDEAAMLRDGIGQLYAEIERTEAALEQAELDAEQQERNYRVLMGEKASYREAWKYEQQRRARAESALAAVRALHKRFADDTCFADGESYPCPTIAALDAHTNPKDQPRT